MGVLLSRSSQGSGETMRMLGAIRARLCRPGRRCRRGSKTNHASFTGDATIFLEHLQIEARKLQGLDFGVSMTRIMVLGVCIGAYNFQADIASSLTFREEAHGVSHQHVPRNFPDSWDPHKLPVITLYP